MSGWVSPPLLVLELWAGCPGGLAQAGSTTPEGSTVMLMIPCGPLAEDICVPCYGGTHQRLPAGWLRPFTGGCYGVCGAGAPAARRDAPGMLPARDRSRRAGTGWDPAAQGASAGDGGHASGQPSPDTVLIPPRGSRSPPCSYGSQFSCGSL